MSSVWASLLMGIEGFNDRRPLSVPDQSWAQLDGRYARFQSVFSSNFASQRGRYVGNDFKTQPGAERKVLLLKKEDW